MPQKVVKYEDCKDSVEHHRHSGNWPAVPGDQNQDEVADAPKEATAHIRQTVPHAPFLADRGRRDVVPVADPGVSGPDVVAMGSIQAWLIVNGNDRGHTWHGRCATRRNPFRINGATRGTRQVASGRRQDQQRRVGVPTSLGRRPQTGNPDLWARVSDEMYTAIREADYEQFKAELISIHQSRAI